MAFPDVASAPSGLRSLVDYVHVMSKGRVVYSSRPEELWANDAVKASYLGI
jgi:ABC-type branched-subunit amino acid transport system ATPase component